MIISPGGLAQPTTGLSVPRATPRLDGRWVSKHRYPTGLNEQAMIELEVWGEPASAIAARGHLDLTAFTEAADWVATDYRYGPDAGLPAYDAEHRWYRPVTRAWFGARFVFAHMDAAFARLAGEGLLELCGPFDDGAQAWTVIDAG
jgi:hypothetical protein